MVWSGKGFVVSGEEMSVLTRGDTEPTMSVDDANHEIPGDVGTGFGDTVIPLGDVNGDGSDEMMITDDSVGYLFLSGR